MSTAEEEERQVSLVSEVSVSPKSSAIKLCNTKFTPKDNEEVPDSNELPDPKSPDFHSVIKSNSIIGAKTITGKYINQNGASDKENHSTDEILKPNVDSECVRKEETIDSEGKEVDNESSVVKPVQVVLTPEQLSLLSKEELVEKWNVQDRYISSLQSTLESTTQEVNELKVLRSNDDRLKSQLSELQRKEQYHIMRLATKEHEIQELGAQIEELKNMTAGGNSLKNSLLDPAVNLLFERMKRDFDTTKAKMEETQNELAAWKFTPDSNTGKQLMAKCRLLIKENEELGKMISSGRLAKLEGDLALQRNFSDELKKSQSELEEFLQEMDEDTEGMQGTILYLQSQLRQAKEKISHLTTQVSMGQNTSNNTPASGVETADYAEGSFSEIEPIIHNEDSSQRFSDEGRTSMIERSDNKYLLKESCDANDDLSTLSTKRNGDLMANVNSSSSNTNSSSTVGSGECSHSLEGSNTQLKSFPNGRKRTRSVLDESGGEGARTPPPASHHKRTRVDTEEGREGEEEGEERGDNNNEEEGTFSDHVLENGLTFK